MKFGSLFTGGIRPHGGGFDIGFIQAGMTPVWECEITRGGDVKTLEADRLGSVDLICGGPPCQKTSAAAKITGGVFWGGEFHGGEFWGGEFHGGVFHGGIGFQGSRHFANIAKPGYIQIGCKLYTFVEWQRDVEKIAGENGYTPGQAAEYRAIVEFLIAVAPRYGMEDA